MGVRQRNNYLWSNLGAHYILLVLLWHASASKKQPIYKTRISGSLSVRRKNYIGVLQNQHEAATIGGTTAAAPSSHVLKKNSPSTSRIIIREQPSSTSKPNKYPSELCKERVIDPLVGPNIAADHGPAPAIGHDFTVPDNLRYTIWERDVHVGFQRLRWAFLSSKSQFVTEGWYKNEARYAKIEMTDWDKHANLIGEPTANTNSNVVGTTCTTNNSINHPFVNARKKAQYLMPKNIFVSANMCYETHCIIAYSDYCFCLRKQATTPHVPFGNKFISWTQYLVINTGNNTCRIICSVEPQFLNGRLPVLLTKQITAAMKAGTKDLFSTLGTTIDKYSAVSPK